MSDIEFLELLKSHLQLERIMTYPKPRVDYLLILTELEQEIQLLMDSKR